MSLDVAVLLVIHRRSTATRRVFEAIAQAQPRRLFIAADGPATADDRRACDETRAAVEHITWPCEVSRDYRDGNLGLNQRMVSALDWVFGEADEAVVLEDDCLPHPDFFRFCSEMLGRYRDDTRILHVSGECYRLQRADLSSYFFSKYPLAWGWASWRRAWSRFDRRMTSWPQVRAQPGVHSLFESEDERAYWMSTFDQMYRAQSAGKDFPWDYSWYHACMWSGLSIHPAVNLVANIGSGALASHTHDLGELSNRPTGRLEDPLRHPDRVVRDRQADLDTFDHRFPGALLRRQRSVAHQIGRPTRWVSRFFRRLSGGSH